MPKLLKKLTPTTTQLALFGLLFPYIFIVASGLLGVTTGLQRLDRDIFIIPFPYSFSAFPAGLIAALCSYAGFKRASWLFIVGMVCLSNTLTGNLLFNKFNQKGIGITENFVLKSQIEEVELRCEYAKKNRCTYNVVTAEVLDEKVFQFIVPKDQGDKLKKGDYISAEVVAGKYVGYYLQGWTHFPASN